MELVTIVNILVIFILVLYIIKTNGDKERERFQEFVKAILAKDLQGYAETLPEEGEDEEPVEDDLADVDSIDEKIFIKHLKREYDENIKD